MPTTLSDFVVTTICSGPSWPPSEGASHSDRIFILPETLGFHALNQHLSLAQITILLGYAKLQVDFGQTVAANDNFVFLRHHSVLLGCDCRSDDGHTLQWRMVGAAKAD